MIRLKSKHKTLNDKKEYKYIPIYILIYLILSIISLLSQYSLTLFMNSFDNKNKRNQKNDRYSLFKYNNESSSTKKKEETFEYKDSLFPSLEPYNKTILNLENNINTNTTTTTQTDDYLQATTITITKQTLQKNRSNHSQENNKSLKKDVDVDITIFKYDFTPVIKMWQKRKDEYIDLYGLDIYEKMFIFPNKIYNDYDVDNDVEDKIYTTEYENYDEIYDVYY